MEKKILIMREKLNCLLDFESIDSEKALYLSQKLDEAILEYYKTWVRYKS